MPRRAAAAPPSTGAGTGAAEGPWLRLPRGLTVGFPGGRASGSVDELVARERPLSTRPAPADPASRQPLPTTARGGCGSSRVGHPAAHMASLGNGADGPHAQLGPPTLTLLARRGGPCSRPHRFAHLDSLPVMKLLAREVRRALVEVPALTPPLVSRVYEQILLLEAGTVSIWSPHEHLAIDVCN